MAQARRRAGSTFLDKRIVKDPGPTPPEAQRRSPHGHYTCVQSIVKAEQSMMFSEHLRRLRAPLGSFGRKRSSRLIC